MSIEEYIEKIKEIQINLLSYIDDDKNIEENFQLLDQTLKDQKILDNRPDLKLFLYFLSNVVNNHNRQGDFFKKIEKIVQSYQNEIKKFFTNSEIYDIFKGNKRILLFLIKSNIIKIDKAIISKMTSNKYYLSKYPQYFYPEIKDLLDPQQQINLNPNATEDFDEKRNNGENDEIICELIRKDLVKEFIAHMNKTNLPLDLKIKSSIFETNSFLFENGGPTLIQYAAFFGSIQIFQYLRINDADLTSSLWLYAIHGCNSEIIHQLEDSHVDPPIKIRQEEENEEDENDNDNEKEEEESQKGEENNQYNDCLKESIICHHNDIANFFINNYYQSQSQKIHFVCSLCLKYHNYAFLSKDSINISTFYELCKYGYYTLANFLLKEKEIDINKISQSKEIVCEMLEIDKITDDEVLRKPTVMPVIKQKIRVNTPLYIAIKKQNFDIVELLLSNDKIDVNIPNKGLTVESLANRNLYPNEIRTQNNAFCMAIEVGNIEIIKLLLSNEKVDTSKSRIKENLHKWGPGPEQGKYTTEKPPLFIAFEKGDLDVYKFLLSSEKVDLNSPSKFTIMNPHGIFENFSVHETTLLNKFVEDGDIDNLKLLLETGRVDVNVPNTEKTYSQYTQIFRGTQTVGQEESQKVAIQIAIEKENNEIAKLLLQQKNIDVDIEDENGHELFETTKDTEIKKLIEDILEAKKKEEPFVIEPICTFEASGEAMINQCFYLCRTCGLNMDGESVEGCCEVCAHRCHKGHDIYRPRGKTPVPSYCDCPGSGKCTCNKHDADLKCTGEITKGTPVTQPMYQCEDCGISGDSYLCQSCAINHHHGHKLTFKYKVKNGVCCNYHPS